MGSLRSVSHVSVVGIVLMVSAGFALSGDLNPPGPPAPTMKTLSEVEPRIAINSTNTPGDADSLFRITQPGSYYLTGNLIGVAGKSGIEIDSASVTVDLMGFDVVGGAGSFSGIIATATPTVRNLDIRHGTVRSWGQHGVRIDNAENSIVKDIRAQLNGIHGVFVGALSIVDSCVAWANGNTGIFASGSSVIVDSAAQVNVVAGIFAGPASVVSRTIAQSNTGHGMNIGSSSTISECVSSQNGGIGILAAEGNTIVNNSVLANGTDGIQVSGGSLILENTCRSNGQSAADGAGIHANNNQGKNRIEGNHVTDNDIGVKVDSTGNIVVRNSASGNGTGYLIPAGNDVGPIGTAALSTSPWANIEF